MESVAWQQMGLWTLFFLSSIYGHVALKVAADAGTGSALGKVWSGMLTPWGISAIASWSLSGFLWMMVLSGRDLHRANSISALRYVLICAAAAAFLGEKITTRDACGIALIASGLLLTGKG